MLVHDEGPRLFWKLAKVIEPLEGPDGVVRVARIKLSGHVTTRPIVKLYPQEEDAMRPASSLSDLLVCQEDTSAYRPNPRPLRRAAAQATQGWRDRIEEGAL